MDRNIEDILKELPTTIYKITQKRTAIYNLKMGVMVGGGWYAFYQSAYSRKAFSYGDVTGDTFRDCLIKCLNEINLLKERADENIKYSYDKIK